MDVGGCVRAGKYFLSPSTLLCVLLSLSLCWRAQFRPRATAAARVCCAACTHTHTHTYAEFEGRDNGNDNDVDDEFDDDGETVKGMARLFCEVAEAYIQLILAATADVSCGDRRGRVVRGGGGEERGEQRQLYKQQVQVWARGCLA